jgi:integrase
MHAGELGTVRVTVLANGRVQADARMRDEAGALRRLKAVRATEPEARAALDEQADTIRYGTLGPRLTARSTLSEACAVFLAEKRSSATVEVSTLETYEFSIVNVVVPAWGSLLMTDLTVLRCNRMLANIRETRSLSASRKTRSILSQVCATAIDHGVLLANPIRDTRALPLTPKKESVLSVEQLAVVKDLLRRWRLDTPHHGPRPQAQLLEQVMWIMVGTSARIGEVLALRRCDVDVTSSSPTVLIAATITQTRAEGVQRKPAPKRTRQKRRVTLPSFSATAIRQRLSTVRSNPDAYLFPTRTGQPMSVSNFERLMRSFVTDCRDPLLRAGIDVEEFTTHVFRRTAATLVEAAAGITLASRLLGHANEQVTRASYVVTAEAVDPVTAVIMEDAIGGLAL